MSKPITFPEVNTTYKGWEADEEKPEVLDLPVLRTVVDGENYPIVVSCWKMSWRERVIGLFIGKLWISVMSSQHPPIYVTTEKGQIINE